VGFCESGRVVECGGGVGHAGWCSFCERCSVFDLGMVWMSSMVHAL